MSQDPVTFGVGQGTVFSHEFAGTVAAKGAEVTGFALGDRPERRFE